MEVVQLAAKAKDGKLWSPETALNDALADLTRPEGFPATKAMVLLLDDQEGRYLTHWYQAGMKRSECVALLEIVKAEFLAMGQL